MFGAPSGPWATNATGPTIAELSFCGLFSDLQSPAEQPAVAFTGDDRRTFKLLGRSAEVTPRGVALYTAKALVVPAGVNATPPLAGLVIEEHLRLPPGTSDVEYRVVLDPAGGSVRLSGDGRQNFGGVRAEWGPGFRGTMSYDVGDGAQASAKGLIGPSTNAQIQMGSVGADATWLSLTATATERSLAGLTLGRLGARHPGSVWGRWRWGLADWQAKFEAATADQGPIPLLANASAPVVRFGNLFRVSPPGADAVGAAAQLFRWFTAGGNASSPSSSNVSAAGPQSTVSVFGGDGEPAAAGLAATASIERPGTFVGVNGAFDAGTGVFTAAAAAVSTAALRAAVTVRDTTGLVLSASIASLSPGARASLEVRLLRPPGVWTRVTSTATAGAISAKLSAVESVPTGSASVAVQLTLENSHEAGAGARGLSATLSGLSLAPAPAAAPVLVSPRPGHNVTDVAVHYSWWAVPGCTLYDVEVCRTADCAAGSVLHYHVAETIAYINFHPSANASSVLDYALLEPGGYWWRVRGVDAGGDLGVWGVSAAPFWVNDEHTTAPTAVREVSPRRPLVHITCWLQEQPADMDAFADTLPHSMRHLTSIVFSDRNSTAMDLVSFMAPAAALGARTIFNVNIAPKSGPGHPAASRENIADIEWLFQRHRNIHGLRLGELYWSFFDPESGNQAYHYALIKICQKYGRYFVWGDGDAMAWEWQRLFARPVWRKALLEAAPYVVLEPKNNIFPGFWTAESELYGAFLSGLIGNLGAWDEAWYWTAAGFGNLNETLNYNNGSLRAEPGAFRQLYFLQSAAQGATVYSIDGQSSTTATPGNIDAASVWFRNGTARDNLGRFVAPFFAALVTRGLIPTREQVRSRVRIAVTTPNQTACTGGDGVCPSGGTANTSYGDYGAYRHLFNGTYGFRPEPLGGQGRQLLHNAGGRYGAVPVLPFPPLPQANTTGIRLINLTAPELDSAAKVRSVFDAAYPPLSAGDALVFAVGKDSLVVTSPFENAEISTSFIINGSHPLFRRGAVTGIRGTAELQSYLIVQMASNGGALWLQAQGRDANATSSFKIACRGASAPHTSVRPVAAAVTLLWDAALRELDVVLSHVDGAVELNVTAP